MNIRFNLKASCVVKNADEFPSQEEAERYIEEYLFQEMGIDADITISDYRQCNF